MADTRAAALEAVRQIVPFDALEVEHRRHVLAWLEGGAPIVRYRKPNGPPEHLVAYCVGVDEDYILLADHRIAGLWLPTGGHVEAGEDPSETATREAQEELGVPVPLHDGLAQNPLFVTRSATVGDDVPHVDVSLWYVMRLDRRAVLWPDPGEFRSVRWWSFQDAAGLGDVADPHLGRFVKKLQSTRIAPT